MTTSIPKNRHPIIRPSATHFRLTFYLFSRLPFVIISTWTCLLFSSQLPDVLFEIIPDRWRSSPVVVPICVIVHCVPICSWILEVDRPNWLSPWFFPYFFPTYSGSKSTQNGQNLAPMDAIAIGRRRCRRALWQVAGGGRSKGVAQGLVISRAGRCWGRS